MWSLAAKRGTGISRERRDSRVVSAAIALSTTTLFAASLACNLGEIFFVSLDFIPLIRVLERIYLLMQLAESPEPFGSHSQRVWKSSLSPATVK